MSSKGAIPFFSVKDLNFLIDIKILEIYTDGCCVKNPGDGGYAILFITEERVLFYKDRKKNTTSNIMELLAVCTATDKKLKYPVIIYTDSKYVADGYNKYISNWIKNGWRNNQNKPVANLDLWKRLYSNMENSLFEIKWVKSHNNLYFNELADKLAKEAAGLF